ncbi:hatching enzyme 1.2-like [Panonychus citri]|uniref:hatching enzyme 1.2-like n=1 Tax=Panonychus citri TaxID=50023 RepID=UPI00230756FA|nr:hatching enzyme 1.2-like [Panonychus citri]
MLVQLIFFSLILIVSSSVLRYSDSSINENNNLVNDNGEENEDLIIKRYQLAKDQKHGFIYDPDFYTTEIKRDTIYPLTRVDFERGSFLSEDDIIGNDSVLYSSDYYEGDIVEDLRERNAVLEASNTWPNGRIPYVLSRKFSERDRAVIARAMATYHNSTCVKFEARTNDDSDYIYIYPGLGCASLVGKVGRMQPVLLGRGCVYSGIVEHELMHATGFWHEQSRADRDSFVKINWDNIERGMEYNFAKLSLREITHLGEPYDYNSVMHYGSHAFAKGFGATISPLKDGVSIGQRRGLSETDIKKINKLYKCNDEKRVSKKSKRKG